MHVFQLCEMCVLGANKKVKVKNVLKKSKIKKKHIHICTTLFFFNSVDLYFWLLQYCFSVTFFFVCVYLVVFFKLTPACIVFFFSS